MPASPLPRKGDSWLHISSTIRIIHGVAGGWHRNRNLLSYLQLSPIPRRYTALGRSLRTRYASHTHGSTHRSVRICEAVGTHPDRRLAYPPRLSQVSPCAGASPAMGHAAPSQASVWDAAPSQAERREPVIASPDPDSTSIPAAVYLYWVPGSHRGSWYPVDPAAVIFRRSLPGACSPAARAPPDLRPRPSRASPPGCRAYRRAGSGSGRPLQPQARIGPLSKTGYSKVPRSSFVSFGVQRDAGSLRPRGPSWRWRRAR